MIRLAKLDDVKFIDLLDKEAFKDNLGYDYLLNDIKNNPMAKYFVYENEEKKILGYLGSWIDLNSSILNFCVKEEYRHLGIGQALFNEFLKYAQGSITLEVRVSNLNAINFYLKNDFKKVCLRKDYYSNHEDAILMMKELN